jgi:hypothetical protein
MDTRPKREMRCVVGNDTAVDIGGVEITPSTSQMAYSLRQLLIIDLKDHKLATSSKLCFGFAIATVYDIREDDYVLSFYL